VEKLNNQAMKRGAEKEIYLILHNIRSAYNIGSIFRTAEAVVGVKKIFLTGYSPTPVDKFGKINLKIKKTALGAEKIVKWEKYQNISYLIAKLKSRDIKLVAVEQSPASQNYRKFKPKYPLAFVFGNEIRGLSKRTLKQCDVTIEIPMPGQKKSLNVSIAAAIVLFSSTLR
jgi:tRNA G18 (ribose-2'-O)-methylase SpoU